MNKYAQKAIVTYRKARSFFPSSLPFGIKDFDDFCDDILYTHALPDNPSYRHAVATAIMHLGPTTHAAPKRYFVKTIRKAMANQVAFEQIQRLKKLEDEYIKKHTAEVTAATEATTDVAVSDKV